MTNIVKPDKQRCVYMCYHFVNTSLTVCYDFVYIVLTCVDMLLIFLNILLAIVNSCEHFVNIVLTCFESGDSADFHVDKYVCIYNDIDIDIGIVTNRCGCFPCRCGSMLRFQVAGTLLILI